MSFDVEKTRKDFPILSREIQGNNLTYLDNAASSQKPIDVLEGIKQFESNDYSNVHRGLHTLSVLSTSAYEESRKIVQKFLNAKSLEEIIFTSGGTDSVNLVASSYADEHLSKGDEIIITTMEHHANIVPWHFLRKKKGAVIKFLEIDDKGNLKIEDLEKLITKKTKIISLTHMSNVTGTIVDIKKVVEIAKIHNIPVCVDGTQGAAHLDVNLKDIDCDFYAFSGHKMYGPTGVGILNIKYKWLEAFEPFIGGGGMIDNVSKEDINYAKGAWKFEAGTMPTAEIIALNESINFINSIGKQEIIKHENQLTKKALKDLKNIKEVSVVGDPNTRGGVFSFNLKDIHSHDVSTIFDSEGIAVRGGHHCCQILHDKLNLNSSVRVSFGVYNDEKDIDVLLKGIGKCQSVFKK